MDVGRPQDVLRRPRAGYRRAVGVHRAFTMVELLVVIVVIVLLISIIGLVGVQVVQLQKRTATETVMKATRMAIDQFENENPLRLRYDQPSKRTFGPYPPYVVQPSGLADLIEAADPNRPSDLEARFEQDFNVTDMAFDPNMTDGANDDIRALYVYLKGYAPDVLSQVPAWSLKAITPRGGTVADSTAYIAKAGSGSNVIDRTEILGIHDAWGVPLDYFLYVKLDYGMDSNGNVGWRIVDRVPALRSHGVKREIYDAGNDTAEDWMFDTAMPTPKSAEVLQDGKLKETVDAANNGWARAVAEGDFDDPNFPNDPVFGFVP